MPQQGQQQLQLALPPSLPQRAETNNAAYPPTNRPLQTAVSDSPVTASMPFVQGGNFETTGMSFPGPFEQQRPAGQASSTFCPTLPANPPVSTASPTCFPDFSQVSRSRIRPKRSPFTFSQQPKSSMVQPGFPESDRLSTPFSGSIPSSASSPPSTAVTTAASISSFANDIGRIPSQGFNVAAAAIQANSHSSSSSPPVGLENHRERFAPPPPP
ncbi:unnamed protein product, partial [Dibothriocephalus latus]